MTQQSNKEKQNDNATLKVVSTNTRISNIARNIIFLLLPLGVVGFLFENYTVLMIMYVSIGAVVFFALMIAAIMKDKEEKEQAACKKNEMDSNTDTDH